MQGEASSNQQQSGTGSSGSGGGGKTVSFIAIGAVGGVVGVILVAVVAVKASRLSRSKKSHFEKPDGSNYSAPNRCDPDAQSYTDIEDVHAATYTDVNPAFAYNYPTMKEGRAVNYEECQDPRVNKYGDIAAFPAEYADVGPRKASQNYSNPFFNQQYGPGQQGYLDPTGAVRSKGGRGSASHYGMAQKGEAVYDSATHPPNKMSGKKFSTGHDYTYSQSNIADPIYDTANKKPRSNSTYARTVDRAAPTVIDMSGDARKRSSAYAYGAPVTAEPTYDYANRPNSVHKNKNRNSVYDVANLPSSSFHGSKKQAEEPTYGYAPRKSRYSSSEPAYDNPAPGDDDLIETMVYDSSTKSPFSRPSMMSQDLLEPTHARSKKASRVSEPDYDNATCRTPVPGMTIDEEDEVEEGSVSNKRHDALYDQGCEPDYDEAIHRTPSPRLSVMEARAKRSMMGSSPTYDQALAPSPVPRADDTYDMGAEEGPYANANMESPYDRPSIDSGKVYSNWKKESPYGNLHTVSETDYDNPTVDVNEADYDNPNLANNPFIGGPTAFTSKPRK